MSIELIPGIHEYPGEHPIRAHGIDGPIVDKPLQIPRNLTDEESIVYEKQLDSESIETGLKLF